MLGYEELHSLNLSQQNTRNIVEPREENMEEDDQTYMEAFIAELDVEVGVPMN